MTRPTPISTPTATLFPYTTLVRSARTRALHPLQLPVPGGRDGAARRHDRRHRAHPARTRRRAAAEHFGAARAAEGGHDRTRQGSDPGGRVMAIGLAHYLTVAAVLLTLGLFGIFLHRQNVIIILMSIELMLRALNINLGPFSTHPGDPVW